MAREVRQDRSFASNSIPLSTIADQVRSGNVSMGQLAQAEPAGIADDSCYEKEDAKFSDAEKGHAMLPIFKHTTDSPEFNLHPKHSNHKPAQGWTPDRGQGFYHAARERRHRPSLVETGKNAGTSRVDYTNRELMFVHSWLRDSFISALNTPLKYLAAAITVVYIITFFFFAAIWWGVHRANPSCITGINGFAMAYNFSMVTQQTIGYGNSAPNDCYLGSFLITVQTIVGLFLDSITLGIIFARISHPKNRGRTIGISDSSVISRRDGILKFMFRIADFRDTQVVEPAVKAYLYTWGKGRTTAEGEHIPTRIEQMEIHHIDGMLLLPIIIEHTIDERSPLCGHTFDTLQEVDAEIIVTFEGTTEMGNPFMARQSYLPTEIHWGHQFCGIIRRPKPPGTRFKIEIEKFHDVEPMPGLEMMPPGPLSKLVVSRAIRTVPYPLLGENTLVLSDSMVLAKDEKGTLALMFRVGDTYPTQHLDVQLKVYLYRWKPKRTGDCGKPDDVEITMLEVGYEFGDDRILLWLPWVAKHVITKDSPLSNWLSPSGFMADADSCIAVVAEAYMYTNSQNRMRMRIYNVLEDVKRQHAFEPIITSPLDSPDYKPRVDWVRFHNTRPLQGAPEKKPAASPQARSTDSTLAVSSIRPNRRDQLPLSKVSFVPQADAPPLAGTEHITPAPGTIYEGSRGESDSSSPSMSTEPHSQAEQPQQWAGGEPRSHTFHRSSFPPESSATMLTPANDPESTFTQRPLPPHILQESIPEEGEDSQTGTSMSSIGALARSSARSLKKAFSRDME